MVAKLVAWNDPVLYTPTKEMVFGNGPIDDENLDWTADEYLELVVENLKASVIHYGGYGLSANQIGYNAKIFVMSVGTDFLTFINPKIVSRSSEENMLDEGCLSFPGLIAKISRSSTIRLRYQTVTGKTETKQFNGLTARVIQHEMCHLNGKPFFTGFSKFKIDRIVKKSNKNGTKYSTLELCKL